MYIIAEVDNYNFWCHNLLNWFKDSVLYTLCFVQAFCVK
nr:MAG TPA: hypothetical protein [Caudoviricetes sp.]DAT99530.1 MAG TPA: hypothetical protein [Caudoviricetes sp.]